MITLNRRERMTLAVMTAALLTLPALHPLYAGGDWVLRCAGAVLAVSVVGFLGRLSGVPTVLQPLVGLIALLFYVMVVFAGSTLSLIVPTADTFRVLGDLIRDGSDDIQTLNAPVPTADSLVLLGVLAVGGIAVLVDTVAVVLGKAALSGLPLLLLFAAPAAIGGDSAGWAAFAAAGLGWLLVLLADGIDRAHRWGVALAAPGARAKPGAGLGYAGARIGVAAVALAVVLPVLLPDVGDGKGDDGDDGPRTITTYNPLTRLRGELVLPEPRTVLTYTTDDPNPDYLRMTTLEVYDGGGWQQGTLNGRLDEDGVEDRSLPTPVGQGGSLTSPVNATIDIASLNAYWLPSPATPKKVEVEGPWLWDERSQSVFATRTDTTKIGPYTVRAERVTPAPGALAAAGTSFPSEIAPFAKRPSATRKVQQITAGIVRGQTSSYGKAKALQDYFQSGAFRYRVSTTSGGSPDALEDFLDTKVGFCEQYASAMGAMLRLAGVPARVAVGFTTGKARPDGSRVITTEEAHAWPEAWIEGAGWVRFEPTPGGTAVTPEYTEDATPNPAATNQATPTPTTSAAPDAEEETAAERAARLREEAAAAAPGGGAGGGDTDSGVDVPVRLVLSVLGLLALLALPGATHVLRRRARWQRPGAAAAWAQLQDDAYDAGRPLDPSRSPRQVRAGLADVDGAGQEALGRIALAVERDRYAPAGAQAGGGDLQPDTALVRHALHERLTRWQRLRLLALPPSTLRWARDGVSGAIRTALDAVAGVGAGLTSKVRLRRS